MRIADRRTPFGRTRTLAVAVAIGLLAGACGGGPPSTPPGSPTPIPTPAATPVIHLSEPAKADSVYLALLAAGLKIAPNNASSGGPGREPVKRINATYAGWPLAISQYSSSKSLQDATKWKSGTKPGQGEASITFVGLNILVQWGPTTGTTPKEPEGAQLAAAEALHRALDPLVSPLAARMIVPIPGVAVPTPEPSVNPKPKATPKPTKKP